MYMYWLVRYILAVTVPYIHGCTCTVYIQYMYCHDVCVPLFITPQDFSLDYVNLRVPH